MALTQTEAGPYRLVVITSWMFSHATAWAIASGIGILLPSISSEFQLSYTQQGLISSVPIWANIALAIPLSIWTTSYRPNILTTVTLALGTLFVFLQASASTFIILLASRLAFGLTMAAREPARVRLMQQWFPPREFLLVNGVTAGILCFVYSAILVATPLFLNAFSNDWRATMYLFSGLFALLAILWAIVGHQRVTQEYQLRNTRKEASLLKGVLRHRELWMTGLGFLGATLPCGAFLAFYPTFMLDWYNFPLTLSGLVLALSFVVGGITSFAINRIPTDWTSRAKVLYLFGLIMPCSYIVLLLSNSLPLLLIVAVVNGITWAFFPILLTVIFHLSDLRIKEVPIAHAFMFTTFSLGMATGPILTGFLHDTLDNPAAVLICMSLPAFSIVVAGFSVRNLAYVTTHET